MTDGHCFISYSTADAQGFANKLADELAGGYPPIPVWFDKRDLRPGMEWDIQIDDGLKGCKLLFFVMTTDSTNEKSVCKQEWSRALSYKKTVIPLLLHQNINTPFRLGDRQRIDFTGDFETGVAQLRRHLAWMDSPAGELQAFKDRLSDAERDLQRAKDADKPRIKKDIEELTEQIKRQEEIVRNPKAAEEKTEKNIQSGLERERQPEKPVAGKTSTRFINPPPGIAPNYFQDRLIETKQITDFLNNDSQRLMTIVGRAGVGKTAIVCRLLKALERGELPDDLGEMKVDGIVYLSETGSHRVNFANVFADLSKLLPKDDAERLEGIYKNPQTSTGDKMRALLDAFPSGRVILLLDNFETLIDPESLSLRDSELSDALNALLGGQHHAVKAVITTRIAPRDLAMGEPGRQHPLSLDEGLESPYAENVLRKMDADGRVGLKTAPDALLNKAREKTRGYPRALEALYAILSVDRYTTLEELLVISLPDEVVQKLVGEAFNRLDPSAQKVMQALAVYNRPVSPAAIDYLLQPHLPSIDSALVLNRLVNMHFARREAGRYYLHPADKEYAFSIIPVEELLTTKDTKVTKENQEDEEALRDIQRELDSLLESSRSLRASRLTAFTQHDLLNRAADYFAQARKPRAEWKKLDDLAAQLAEFELRCDAGDYDTAAEVITDIDFDFLSLWGYSNLVLKYRINLISKINNKKLEVLNHCSIGYAYRILGNYKDALKFLEHSIFQEQKIEYGWQGRRLSDIAHSYLNLGDYSKAMDYYNKALAVARENNNRSDEGRWLANLGFAKNVMKDYLEAISLLEEALSIARETNDKRGEGSRLEGLAHAHYKLGDIEKSIQLHKEALAISKSVKDRRGEGIRLSSLGEIHLKLSKYQEAYLFTQDALQIANEMHDKKSISRRLNTLGRIHQSQGNKDEALKNYQEAAHIAKEIGDLQGEGIILNNLGVLHHYMGENAKAKNYILQAIEIANRLDDSKARKSRVEKLNKIEQSDSLKSE